MQALPQNPPTFSHTPESLLADATRLIESYKALQDQIVRDVTVESATFGNVVLPLARETCRYSAQANILSFYREVSGDAKLREASLKARRMGDDFIIEAYTREDLFRLVNAALEKHKNDESLDVESRRLLEKEHQDFVRMGLGLPQGPQRDRFKEIQKRLAELATTFAQNMNEDMSGLWLTREDLIGVSADLLDHLKQGEQGTPEEGKLWVTFKYTDYFPVMRECKNEDIRKKVLIARENKTPENVPIFKETIVLRDEAARLLGYPNHAAFALADKMAKTPEAVNDFLADLRSRLRPLALAELEKLTAMKATENEENKEKTGKRDNDNNDNNNLYLWDYYYYNKQMLERDYKVDTQLVSEYFPLTSCLPGMFNIFAELFGLRFVEIAGEGRDKISPTGKGADLVWHEDVQFFAVWDDEKEGGGFVGYLYLDLFPREGKYDHAANFNIQPGFSFPTSEGEERTTDTKRHYPATALVCNFTKPTVQKPSLLKHNEFVVLFHELGHGIHDLVAKTKFSRFHGTEVVRDFVEAPSQMLENWCWTPSQLKSLGRHYSYLSPELEKTWKERAAETTCSTSKPDSEAAPVKERPAERMPDDLVHAIVKSRFVNGGLDSLRQVSMGIFDMTVHCAPSHEWVEKVDASEIYNKRSEVYLVPGPEALGEPLTWGHGQASFGHMLGGYDAGYYGYLWSEVFAADMFHTHFAANPMNTEQGRRYRQTVLEKGGSQDEMLSLTQFLGREPNAEAFYKELGLQ